MKAKVFVYCQADRGDGAVLAHGVVKEKDLCFIPFIHRCRAPIAQERVHEIIANNWRISTRQALKATVLRSLSWSPNPTNTITIPYLQSNYKSQPTGPSPLVGNEVDYVAVAEIAHDKRQGPAIQTTNPLDLMLESGGYFQVQTDEGVRLTRDARSHSTQMEL